jgi:hypothetical protein
MKFPRPAEERAAVRKVLAGADVAKERQLGPIIFGGDDADVALDEPKPIGPTAAAKRLKQ